MKVCPSHPAAALLVTTCASEQPGLGGKFGKNLPEGSEQGDRPQYGRSLPGESSNRRHAIARPDRHSLAVWCRPHSTGM